MIWCLKLIKKQYWIWQNLPEILKQLRRLYCSALSATVSSFGILFLSSMFSVSRDVFFAFEPSKTPLTSEVTSPAIWDWIESCTSLFSFGWKASSMKVAIFSKCASCSVSCVSCGEWSAITSVSVATFFVSVFDAMFLSSTRDTSDSDSDKELICTRFFF